MEIPDNFVELNANLKFIDTEAMGISLDLDSQSRAMGRGKEPPRRKNIHLIYQATLRRCVFIDAKLPRAVSSPGSSSPPFDVETTPARL